MLVELMLASCPNSRKIQDLASSMGVERVRFKMEDEDCILCGLCVRICAEQMDATAIGFINRGAERRVATPFRMANKEDCRGCGACMYICPVVEGHCRGHKRPPEICGSCLNFQPTCIDNYHDFMCYLGDSGECGFCVEPPSDARRRRMEKKPPELELDFETDKAIIPK
jgi:ferredoxin